MIIRYVLFAVASMVVNLLAYVLSPFLAAYSVWKDIDVLPYPWSLFHTHDNTLDGGQKQGYRIGARGLSLWWQRVCWICRNPGYGFDAYILGFAHAGYRVLSEKGDQDSFGVDDRGTNGATRGKVADQRGGQEATAQQQADQCHQFAAIGAA